MLFLSLEIGKQDGSSLAKELPKEIASWMGQLFQVKEIYENETRRDLGDLGFSSGFW